MHARHQITLVRRRAGRLARPEVATADTDGRLYVRHNARWWMLSNPDEDGERSINVAPCDPALDARLNAVPPVPADFDVALATTE